MTVYWNDVGLKTRLRLAFPVAGRDYLSLARAKFPSRTIASRLNLSVRPNSIGIVGPPEASFFEEGVGPHVIEPKEGTVLRLADGSFVTGAIRHPGMEAQPTLKPLLSLFPTLYRRRATATMRLRV